MRKVFVPLFAGITLSGCDRLQKQPVPSQQIKGQAFIVTEARVNVKLGLLPVYVADREVILDLLTELEDQVIQSIKNEKQNLVDSRAFDNEFSAYKNELILKQEFLKTSSAFENKRKLDARYISQCLAILARAEKKVPRTTSSDSDLFNYSASRFLDLLEESRRKGRNVSFVKTDADGNFSTNFVGEQAFISAQSNRKVGDKEETYFWLHPATFDSNEFLANDNLIESREDLRFTFGTIGNWNFPDEDFIKGPSYQMKELIAECNRQMTFENEKLNSRIEEREKAAEKAAEEEAEEEAEKERLRIVEERTNKMRASKEKDERSASKIELFSERLERLKKLKLEDPDQLLGYVELKHDAKSIRRKSDPFSSTKVAEPTLKQLTFRLSKTEKGQPHEKRGVLRQILDKLNTNLNKFGEEPLSDSQFVSVVKAGIPIQVYIDGNMKCSICFGDGKLGALEGFKSCKTCGGSGTLRSATYYRVTWN